MLESEDAPVSFVSVAVIDAGIGARQFQCAFPGFGSAITKKCAVESGNLGQPFCQFRLVLVIEEVRSVNQLPCLLLQNFLDRGMRVAQRIHADSAEEVEIALAG